MKIVDYSSEYDESIKDLLVELQKHISSIDREGYNILTNEYREEYFKKTMDEVKKYEGKIFLAIESENVIGIIIGLINNDDMCTYEFKAPKRGRVTELVVTGKYRSNGVGQLLLDAMEDYFKGVGCKGVLIDVFAYNENAYKFYSKNGYFNRNIEIMKEL